MLKLTSWTRVHGPGSGVQHLPLALKLTRTRPVDFSVGHIACRQSSSTWSILETLHGSFMIHYIIRVFQRRSSLFVLIMHGATLVWINLSEHACSCQADSNLLTRAHMNSLIPAWVYIGVLVISQLAYAVKSLVQASKEHGTCSTVFYLEGRNNMELGVCQAVWLSLWFWARVCMYVLGLQVARLAGRIGFRLA
jgi:hypothetical protein